VNSPAHRRVLSSQQFSFASRLIRVQFPAVWRCYFSNRKSAIVNRKFSMPKRTDIHSVLIIGHACKALREEGYRVVQQQPRSHSPARSTSALRARNLFSCVNNL
jgi:hypothetical protein